MEAIVDAYGSSERAMSLVLLPQCYAVTYLAGKLAPDKVGGREPLTAKPEQASNVRTRMRPADVYSSALHKIPFDSPCRSYRGDVVTRAGECKPTAPGPRKPCVDCFCAASHARGYQQYSDLPMQPRSFSPILCRRLQAT